MGAKTGLLMYADGDIPGLLRHAEAPDPDRTSALVRRSYPDAAIERWQGSTLYNGVYPPPGRAYAGSWPGLDVLADRRLMIDSPSQLPEHLVAAGAGRLPRTARHAQRGRLARLRRVGGRPPAPLPEPVPRQRRDREHRHPAPLRTALLGLADRPADVIPWPGEEQDPYPLPFHPLELGEVALRSLCGFIQEGYPEPDDVDAEAISLLGFRMGDGAIPPRSL